MTRSEQLRIQINETLNSLSSTEKELNKKESEINDFVSLMATDPVAAALKELNK